MENRNGTPNAFNEEEYYPEPVPYVFKLKGEYLNWRVAKPTLSTVLATTSTNPNLANGVGALGDPGTSSLLGPGTYNYSGINGFRGTGGLALGFLPPIEVSGFSLNKQMSLLNRSSDGSATSQVLARPFQGVNLPSLDNLGQEVVLSAGFPGFLAGTINVGAEFNMWGIETNIFLNLGTSEVASLDVFGGYRYTNMTETLSISNSLRTITDVLNISFNTVNNNGLPQGFTSTVLDVFQAQNQFNGGTIGLRPALYVGQFTTSVDLKLSMGSTHQSLKVNGASSLISPDGSVQTFPGGLLAVPSNSGLFTRDVFSIIPELNANVGFNITRNLKLFATYNLFYWSNIIRPGNQLTNRIDSRQVQTDPTFDGTATPTTPAPSFLTSSFWAHGFSVGVEFGF